MKEIKIVTLKGWLDTLITQVPGKPQTCKAMKSFPHYKSVHDGRVYKYQQHWVLKYVHVSSFGIVTIILRKKICEKIRKMWRKLIALQQKAKI